MINLNSIFSGQENSNENFRVILITCPDCEKCTEAKKRLEEEGIKYLEIVNKGTGDMERKLYHSPEFSSFREAGGLKIFNAKQIKYPLILEFGGQGIKISQKNYIGII